MFTILKPFASNTRRYKAGDTVIEAEFPSLEHFTQLQETGHISQEPVTQDPPAAATT